jgi:hypothetical protein
MRLAARSLASLARLAPLVLLLGLACQTRTSQPSQPIYGPWEEGLTLAFEDPSQPQPQRSANRLQLRVARSRMDSTQAQVQLDIASPRGQVSLLLRYQDAGATFVDDAGKSLAQPLPPHFPSVTEWQDRGTEFRVIGRATWEGAALLPATSDPIGIWVEARPPHGPRRRTLYLPNLGEVESREEREGAWIPVNRLVARGYTDLPAIKRH